MQVVKTSGEFEKFDSEKIRRTCVRAGCSERTAKDIAAEVKRRAYEGITTKEILRMTLSLLRKSMPDVAEKYDLKGAIFRLGPDGFIFEEFVCQLLRRHGYVANVHSMVRGACVTHEIDIIASNKEGRFMIECKYHNVPGIYTGLKEALYTYARFLDLRDGFKAGRGKDFTHAWLVCNTKFSDDAIQYANCKGMRLIGWNYPDGQGFQNLIESMKLYPITMLRSLDRETMDMLISAKVVLAADVMQTPLTELAKATGIHSKKLKVLADEARVLYG
jgi:hypothetical protein